MNLLKSHLLVLVILLSGSCLWALPINEELATVEAQRQAALDSAAKDINSRFRQQYLTLLSEATTGNDPLILAEIRIALANVSTVDPEQYAIDALANKKWTFGVPRVGYTGARIFLRNGTWIANDGARGKWKFDRTGLKVFLSDSQTPEIYKFPMNAENWLGVGSQQDVVCLGLAPDFENIKISKGQSDSSGGAQ